MHAISRIVAACTLAACLLAPSASYAGDKISAAYTKRLVREAATDRFGTYARGWKVSLHAGRDTVTKKFRASVNWGAGRHPAIALPSPSGKVNVSKAKSAPRGVRRVTIQSY